MAEKSVARQRRGRSDRSTRHHRCDFRFLEILEEDFGISQFSLRSAFMGVPAAPKRQAIELCEWATRKAQDPEEAGGLIRRWARNRKVGMYDPAITGAPPLTFGGKTGFEMEGV